MGNALKWFPDRRGLAAGLTAAGFGAGAALTVIPIANMIQTSGYEKAFLNFGIWQGVIIFIMAMLMIRPKVPKGVVASARVASCKVDFTSGQMIKAPVFWVIYVLFVAVAAGGLMLVLPYYLHNYKAFGRIVILGQLREVPLKRFGLSQWPGTAGQTDQVD